MGRGGEVLESERATTLKRITTWIRDLSFHLNQLYYEVSHSITNTGNCYDLQYTLPYNTLPARVPSSRFPPSRSPSPPTSDGSEHAAAHSEKVRGRGPAARHACTDRSHQRC